jgi:hypothetical protein
VLKEAWKAKKNGAIGPGIPVTVETLDGGRATVSVWPRGTLHECPRGKVDVRISAGDPLSVPTLRSYVVGAVHQGLGWVWQEGIGVDSQGTIVDLTIRSFGILSAKTMPDVDVMIEGDDRFPRPVADAVFCATAASAWIADGLPPFWPAHREKTTRGTI